MICFQLLQFVPPCCMGDPHWLITTIKNLTMSTFTSQSTFVITVAILFLLGLCVGWAVFTATTTAIQVLAVITLTGALWTYWQEHETAQFGLLFLAGACIGALAYHGTVSILLTLAWLTLLVWVGWGIVRYQVQGHGSQ